MTLNRKLHRGCVLAVLVCTPLVAAPPPAADKAKKSDGWGEVVDPYGDCGVAEADVWHRTQPKPPLATVLLTFGQMVLAYSADVGGKLGALFVCTQVIVERPS